MGFKISGVGLDGSGMTLKQLAAKQGAAADNPIMAAKVDNVLVSLDEEIEKCENIEFIDLDSEGGQRIYRQSVLFLMMMALYELEPQAKLEVHFPIHKSLLVEIQNIGEITEGFINELTMEMKMLVAENLPIERHVVSRERAIQAYSELHRTNSTGFLKESDDESVIMYQCDFFSECMIDILADYTGKLGMFKLELCGNGVALSTPMTENGVRKIRSYVDAPKFISLLNEAKSWGRILRCNYVYEMNQLIRRGDIGDLIRVSEALHEKKIAYIADHIAANRHKLRIVSIAGPSSSGKTSFANRLKIHLRVNGLEPVSISLDDYFVNREDTPRNEKGEFDFILDVYWLAYAAINPAEFIRRVGKRARIIHFKDLEIFDNQSRISEVMEGNLNWDEIIAACDDAGAEYAFIEQDICLRDPFDCLKTSYDNLKTKGFN